MARKHKTVRNTIRRNNRKRNTIRKNNRKRKNTKRRVKKSINEYQDGGFPVAAGVAGLAKTGIGAVVAKKVSDKFRKFSKEQMHKFMKWLLDSSMKALDETLSSVNYSSPEALESMFDELKSSFNGVPNPFRLKGIYDKYKSEIEKLTDFNKLKSQLLKTYKNNLIRILKEDIKSKASELKLNYKSFRTFIDELAEYINKSKTLFHTSSSLERQGIDQQRYTDPSLTPDTPTGISKFGREYLHESVRSDISVD